MTKDVFNKKADKEIVAKLIEQGLSGEEILNPGSAASKAAAEQRVLDHHKSIGGTGNNEIVAKLMKGPAPNVNKR